MGTTRGNEFLKNFNLFRTKSFALASVFIIKVHFLSNADMFELRERYFEIFRSQPLFLFPTSMIKKHSSLLVLVESKTFKKI